MSELALIQHSFEGHEVRTQIGENGEPWFVAKDVCEVLEIKKHRDALTKIPVSERTSMKMDTLGGTQEMTLINEAGMYRLIFRSHKPSAERFQTWIVSEVIPSIRKTGGYQVGERAPLKLIPDASAAFNSLLSVAEKFGFEGNQKILSASKAVRLVTGIDFPELLGATHLIAEKQVRHFTPTELGQRVGMSAIKFNHLLVERGFQEKHNGAWVATDSGKRFAVLLDTGKKHSNGTPVQQLKWLEDVLEFVQQKSA